MNKIPLVIFCRSDSSRLPRKAFLSMGQYTVLELLIRRLLHIPQHPVILATTSRSLDDDLEHCAHAMNIPIFRGSTHNLIQRSFDLLHHFNAQSFVRISGDSPLLCPYTLQEALDFFVQTPKRHLSIFSNTFPSRILPSGNSIEILSLPVVQQLLEATHHDPFHQEHLTSYAYSHPDRFSIVTIPHTITAMPSPMPKLSIDTPEDYQNMLKLLKYCPQSAENITLHDILQVYTSIDQKC